MKDEIESRMKTAIDFIDEGKPFNIGGLNLRQKKSGSIVVAGASRWIELSNITKTIALEEIESIKSRFKEMLKNSVDLKSFVERRDIEFLLYNDDAGKTNIYICSLKHKKLRWHLELSKEI